MFVPLHDVTTELDRPSCRTADVQMRLASSAAPLCALGHTNFRLSLSGLGNTLVKFIERHYNLFVPPSAHTQHEMKISPHPLILRLLASTAPSFKKRLSHHLPLPLPEPSTQEFGFWSVAPLSGGIGAASCIQDAFKLHSMHRRTDPQY